MKLTFRNLKALARVKVAILLFAALFTFFVVNLNLRTKVRRDSLDTNRHNEPLIQWHPDGIATLIKATKEIEQLKIKSTNSKEPKTSPEIQKSSPKRLEPTPAKLTIKIAKPCKLNIENELSKELPRIQLDGNKFMLPFLIWGPNNQLIGLRDSIFLAIKLNRTLVLPHFVTQYNDKGAARNTLVQARNRIDVTNLSKFISVISLKDFQTICLGKMN
uniref:Peptide-O-fucosyltransferase n=1 Tax=Ciona savignyi TaxID=51511 RepID=H2YE79_CIOSA